MKALEDSQPGFLEAVCPHTHIVGADLTWGASVPAAREVGGSSPRKQGAGPDHYGSP